MTSQNAVVEITRVIQSGFGCPSQWDAWDIYGQRYYIRFRFGRLTVDALHPATESTRIFDTSHGDDMAGVLGFAELCGLLLDRFDFTAAVHEYETPC